MVRQPTLYSYVVDHDTGHAPNPYFCVCTLCRCKYRKSPQKPRNVVELAERGDWIVGTGGADPRRSAGHGRLIYAMRVDEKLTREEYYADRRFSKKKRPVENGTDVETRGDNLPSANDFEKYGQFALISRNFYYFGASAVCIPKRFCCSLEKKGPGFKKRFDSAFVRKFVEWLEKNHEPGRHGKPCESKPDRSGRCKSSC